MGGGSELGEVGRRAGEDGRAGVKGCGEGGGGVGSEEAAGGGEFAVDLWGVGVSLYFDMDVEGLGNGQGG